MRKSPAVLPALLCAVLIALSPLTPRAAAQQDPLWTQPLPAYRIADNLYYVGSKDLASYLITTPAGDILINSSLESSVPLIRKSIESLGFKFSDVKILLISHAHFDHAAGSARIKALTGAKYMVMDADVSTIQSGGRTDFQYPGHHYPAAKVDRILHDGDQVKLGNTLLIAHKTPGHTPGCTTWTMQGTDRGRTYNVVIVGSWNVNPGYKLVNNPTYPQIARDFERTFHLLHSLPCDIFLGAHGSYYNMLEKYAAMKPTGPNVFVDPSGYQAAVSEREQAFRTKLAQQQAGGKP